MTKESTPVDPLDERRPDEPRSRAQADLGGGMNTYYREGGFPPATDVDKVIGKKPKHPHGGFSGPIRGESETDTGQPHYHEPPVILTSDEQAIGKEGIEAARRMLEQHHPD